MLFLNPPYYTIAGVTLMPDHEDPLQFYFMPMSPHLSTTAEGALSIPRIALLKFTGRPDPAGDIVSGGFLDLDCNLGIPPEKLSAVAEALRDAAALSDLPKLAPVPLIGGSVRMMLFGAQSPTEEPGPLGRKDKDDDALPGPAFVERIVHAATPSLYGDNEAAFSVRLDQAGATLLDAAMRDEMLPIGVVYSLEYVGLRPAYRVHVHADWDRVQKHLEESESVNIPLIATSSVLEVVDELVEKRIITIESDLLVADGDDPGGATGRYDAALEQVRELVFDNFFTPSVEPMDRESGDTIDDFGRVLRTIATSGMSTVWERKKVDLTRIDRKRLDVDMSERTAVIREIHPQGHLPGIGRTVDAQHLDMTRFVSEVSLEDPFFARRTVRVIPRIDFATDQIESVNVSLTYDGVTKNVVLDAGSEEQSVEWQSAVEGGRVRAPVDVSYEVLFATAATGRPRTLRAQVRQVDGDVVQISPREGAGYELRWISFTVVDFPWDLYPTIEVQCSYADDAHGIRITNSYGLTREAAGGAWPVFAMDPAKRDVSYRVLLHDAGGRDWDSGPLTTGEDQIRITDPFAGRRIVDVVAPSSLFGTQLDRVFVDVWYDDDAHDLHKRESFELSAQDSATKRFMVELADPALRRVGFRVSMLRVDGVKIDIPDSTTEADRIIVTPQMRGHRTVTLTAAGVDFAGQGIAQADVETLYDRPALGLRFAGAATLTPVTPVATFEYDFADGDPGYTYRVVQRFDNGTTRDTGWRPSTADQVVASV